MLKGGILYLLMILKVNAYANVFLNVPNVQMKVVLVLMRVY